jgi:hypothetical protein
MSNYGNDELAPLRLELSGRSADDLLREIAALRKRAAKAKTAEAERAEHIAELADELEAEKRKRRPPADQLAEIERERRSLERDENKFNLAVEAWESNRRRTRKYQLEEKTFALRSQAIRALAEVLPKAKQQARAGKPALLRMILRAAK